ncbi:MAG: endonuclease/exonuclease/phosphatase family protein [Anaerolineaceae bacterium]|jgi:hypothetical protein|nr:endonuclease/exonuclease/phosphatase family protein [Anaerolineaceae bacterium]MDD4042063.1 endonuclease/exonuclease/phosphatase family protein [Anaerolineaceae bacterium]MDD4578690.1 endonuclease/exonuclease/phosphatase family protein [Anaerolineaceae bacterium]
MNQTNFKKSILIFFALIWLSGCIATPPGNSNAQTGSCNKVDQLAISQVQGAGHRSPYDGKEVRCVPGIVTAIDGGGFYMQSQTPDDDPSTSEGVYVDLLAFASVKVGDEVLIMTAEVREYNPAGLGENSLTRTSLRASKVEVLGSGNPLPAPVLLGEGGRTIPDRVIENDVQGYVGRSMAKFDPEEDGMDFFESLEGMRVQVNDAVAVSSINSYNEVTVVADNGKNVSGMSPAGLLLLAEDDPNPERIMLDDKFIRMPAVSVGDIFTQPIIGIVDYDFGNYRILPTEKLVFESMGLVDEITDVQPPELKPSQISVVSLNMLNYSHSESPERTEGFASMIIEQLDSPDILVLQEVMDDDGRLDSDVVSADQNLSSLRETIEAKGGPVYQWFNINPERNTDGGVDGGNIRVVIMFRMDRGLRFLSALPGTSGDEVGLTGEGVNLALTNNPGLIWPNNSAFRQSRKPIIAQFQFQEQNFFVIGAHFNSKGPDGPLYGDQQPPILVSETQRIAQAKAVNGFVKDILERDPQAKILVAGDLNDFPWSEPLRTLAGTQLANLFDTIDRQQWVTYIHEGNAQVMDQMLLSDSFMQNLYEFRPLNINSVLPADQQLSDHDPVLLVLDFNYYE